MFGADGAEVARFAAGPTRVGPTAVSQDGRWVATGHFDGLVRVRAVRSEALLRLADDRCLRAFTAEERAAYPDPPAR